MNKNDEVTLSRGVILYFILAMLMLLTSIYDGLIGNGVFVMIFGWLSGLLFGIGIVVIVLLNFMRR